MSSKSPKRKLLAQLAVVARAIGHEHRLELLEQLAQGERRVELLAERAGLSIANASQHARGDRLGSIEELKRRGDSEQTGAYGDDPRVARKQGNQLFGEEEQTGASSDHDDGPQTKRGPARPSSPRQVARADCMSNADRSR